MHTLPFPLLILLCKILTTFCACTRLVPILRYELKRNAGMYCSVCALPVHISFWLPTYVTNCLMHSYTEAVSSVRKGEHGIVPHITKLKFMRITVSYHQLEEALQLYYILTGLMDRIAILNQRAWELKLANERGVGQMLVEVVHDEPSKRFGLHWNEQGAVDTIKL